MNTPTNNPEQKPAPRRKLWRVLLLSLVWLVTLIFLFYAIENWRGARAWKAVAKDLQARGEFLSMEQILKIDVPPEQNFGSAPFVLEWMDPKSQVSNRFSWAQSVVEARTTRPRQGEPRRPLPLAEWARALEEVKAGPIPVKSGPEAEEATQPEESAAEREKAAAAILAALQPVEPQLAELRSALERPYAKYPLKSEDNPVAILLPHLMKLRSVMQRLQITASAQLAAGDAEAGLQTIFTGFELADTLRKEPLLISSLVRIAGLELMVQPIWEGLRDHRWSRDQLKRLSSRLAEFELILDLQFAIRGERATCLGTIDYVEQTRRFSEFDQGSAPVNALVWLIPKGWFMFEKANYSRDFDRMLYSGVNFTNQTISVEQVTESNREVVESFANPIRCVLTHRLAARMLLPAMSRVVERFATSEAVLNLARLACALEAYRLEHNTYPQSLSAAAPLLDGPTPRDLLGKDGQFRYSPKEDGFLLYSIGWDQQDDLGQPLARKHDDPKGDLVWGYQIR